MVVNKLKSNQIAKLPEGKYLDGNGLYLRVEGNSRRWFLRFRFEGKRHDLGLGRLSLSEARAKAAAVRQEVASGRHPLLVREAEKALKRQQAIAAKGLATTIRDIYGRALEFHIEINAIKSKRWFGDSNSLMIKRALPFIGDKPLVAITPNEIADVLRPVWTTTTGGRLLTCLRACYKYAIAQQLYSGTPPTTWENCLDLLLPKASKVSTVEHQPSVPWKDIPELYQKICTEPDSVKKRILLAVILCVPRISEFIALRVPEVDTKKRIITILKSKTSDEPWGIPYPTQVDALLDFTATHPFGGPVEVSTVRCFFKKHAPEYTIHGFRSSFSSWCADHEKNPEAREACLHHSLGGKVALSYQRSDLFELRRKLLQEWADYVTSKVRPAS